MQTDVFSLLCYLCNPDEPLCTLSQMCLYHVSWFFLCPQAQLIAQSIGQAFSVAYQEFLRANGINPEDLSQKEYSDIINTQEMYNDDLIHFSNSENCKEVGVYDVCISALNFLQRFFFLTLIIYTCFVLVWVRKTTLSFKTCGMNLIFAAGLIETRTCLLIRQFNQMLSKKYSEHWVRFLFFLQLYRFLLNQHFALKAPNGGFWQIRSVELFLLCEQRGCMAPPHSCCLRGSWVVFFYNGGTGFSQSHKAF